MKHLTFLRAAAVAAALAGSPFSAAAGVRAVWAVTDGEKIAHDSRDHPLRARNAAWDGRTVRLFAARNEVVAFQVIVEADERGIAAASLVLPELQLRGGTARIAYATPEADPTRSVGRPIQLFSVNDMKVTQESRADWVWTPGSAAAPKGTLGWKPVQLVPENARAGRGGFPVRVEASESQAFWIEVYTGRGRPAGTYEGAVAVSADGSRHALPVELRLFAFDLPGQNSLDAMVFFEPDQPELYQGRRLDAAYHRFAHRHRVELVHAYDEARVRASLGRFTGADFRPETGYEGPGEGVGNRIVPVSFYGPGPEYAQRESAWRSSDAWMTFLGKALPGARTFLYLPDEPYPQDYPRVRALAENVRTNPGPGQKLPLFLTKSIIPEFQGLVDLWSVPPQALELRAAADERAKGRHVGFYNGGRPNGPSLVIDAPATEARVVAWAALKHGLDLYFFWHGVHWRHNRQKQGERNQDVWRNPITFDNRGQPGKPVEDQGYINGDGVLLYPGEERLHPGEDRGIAGPIGTVQLANLRRGLQDHQYLSLARGLGLEAEVQAAFQAIVPRVFSDAGPSVSFPESGEAFEAARLKLAEAIESKIRAGAQNDPLDRPRLLIAAQDPFSGLPILRARYAAGVRPSDDMAGWALSYVLTGDHAFARRALDAMRQSSLPKGNPSRIWRTWIQWSLAFDWLDRHVLGYAVHRFKDPFAAFVQQKSGWIPERGHLPILDFLWRDDSVAPRDPAATTEAELPRQRLFRGVGHLVLRSGWGPDATWIQLAAGPYFAKHDHLDMNHFVIYHRGHLAIDAGADYTDTESPHYLNHYRRTVAHNTLLVYQKGERFFWGEDRWPAANDGGQRMDSSRFWNTVRSLADWQRTRDLWDRGRIEAFESAPGAYAYARADGTRAYQPSKLDRFVRELTYVPDANVLFVLDRVRSREADFRKAWLLHGVSQPEVEGPRASGGSGGAGTPRPVGHGGTSYPEATVITFQDGVGRLRVHPVLPIERELVARGGPGWEFWTPGDEFGGDWGSGRNWPLDPPEGGPLPADPYPKKMWTTFWGEDLAKLSPSNRRGVVPGGWRIEVSPAKPARDDLFLNVLEIGDQGAKPLRVERILGHCLAGAAVAGSATVLHATRDSPAEAEATVPDVPTAALLLSGLEAGAAYELQLTSGFAPGSPVWREVRTASDAGVIHVRWERRNGRLRVRRLGR